MLTLQVIEGHKKIRFATVQANGIRYQSKLHLPVSVDRLDGGATDPSGSLGGAALGAVTFGAAGAIVGSIAGRRGRTAVLIKTTDGAEMVCTVASHEFPGLYVEVQRLAALAAKGYKPPREPKVTFEMFLLGPFYLLRFGPGWFILGLFLTVITFGLGWLFTLAISANLENSRLNKLASESGAPSGSEFLRAEGDLLPSPKDRPPAP